MTPPFLLALVVKNYIGYSKKLMYIEQLDFITNSHDSKEQNMNPWSANNKDILNKSLNK